MFSVFYSHHLVAHVLGYECMLVGNGRAPVLLLAERLGTTGGSRSRQPGPSTCAGGRGGAGFGSNLLGNYYDLFGGFKVFCEFFYMFKEIFGYF
jgi:hypothetical protein